MTEAVVDQKRAPLPPVDPDAPIPEAVKRRAAAVDALYASNGQGQLPLPEPPAPQATQAPAPQAVAEPVPTVQVTPPPADQHPPPLEPTPPPADPNVDWHRQYLAMQGRYEGSQRTLGEMEEQMRQMGEELLRIQQPPPNRPAPPPQRAYVTDRDLQNFGPDLIDLTQRAAVQVMEPRLAQVAEENQNLRRQIAR